MAMKLLGISLLLAMFTTITFADPKRGNPCGGKPMPPMPDPCGGFVQAPPPPPPRPQLDKAKTYAIRLDADDVFDGAPDARITIVDTYDYACPYCDKVRPTLDALKQKYGKDLRVVYKQFVVHPSTAMAGALAACAANKQHKFAEVDAALWEGYKAGKLDRDAGSKHCWQTKEGCPNALAAAVDAKLDASRFVADMTRCEGSVKSSMADMQSFAVNAIPTFFINGRMLQGAQPQASFEAIIDEELKKADAKIRAGTRPSDYYQTWVVGKGERAIAPKPMNPCGGM